MPLYEYQCDACGQRFEKIQKFSDPPLDRCPACSGSVKKLFSSPAIQFKGSGWYITDYAKKSGTDPGKAADKTGESQDKADKDKPAADTAKSTSDSTTPSKTD